VSAFRKLAAKYASLGVVVGDTAKATADDFKKELEQGFAQGKDANGNPWAPLANGGTSHLEETGKYRSSLNVVALTGVGQSIVEMNTGPAANLHARETTQYPANRAQPGGRQRRFSRKLEGKPWTHPARPLMPIAGQDLPPKWKEIIAKNYGETMREALK